MSLKGIWVLSWAMDDGIVYRSPFVGNGSACGVLGTRGKPSFYSHGVLKNLLEVIVS